VLLREDVGTCGPDDSTYGVLISSLLLANMSLLLFPEGSALQHRARPLPKALLSSRSGVGRTPSELPACC